MKVCKALNFYKQGHKMKKTFFLSTIAASLLMAGGDITPMEPMIETPVGTGVAFNDIKLTDYKIIEGSYVDAYLDAGLTLEGGNQDQTSYNAYVGANTNMLYTTAAYSWSLIGTANGAWSKGPNDGDKTVDNYNAFVSTKFDKYLFNDDSWFVYGSADIGYRKSSEADEADDPYFKAGAGMGYGRMYDATPLAQALRIIEDLIAYKLVDPNITQEAVHAVARVIDIENEYAGKYGALEYKKYWYKAMEDALKVHGALTGDALGAFGIVRITEVLDIQRVFPRFHGWKVRGGFGQVLSNYDGESEDTTFDLGFEYGLPIGQLAQLTDYASFSTVLDSDSNLEYTAQNLLTYTYEIAERIDWDNSWTLGYQAYEFGDDVTTNTLTTGFRYYLANRLTYDATFSMTKTDGSNGLIVGTDDWDTRLYTGITYRLK